MTKEINTYTATDIDVLEGLEGIRKKPGVYVGDVNKTALFQIFKESVDNCIDEFIIGENDKVLIDINQENMSILVADRGRGIPVEDHVKTGFSALTTILTRIHAGGKFSGKSMTVGTHGIGISATNALSSKFEVWTYRSTKFRSKQDKRKVWYYQCFEKGKPITKVKSDVKLPINWDKGTIVRFTPDPTIFVKNYRIPFRKIKDWLSNIKYLCPGLKFILKGEGIEEVFKSESGVSQWVLDSMKNLNLEGIGKRFDYSDNELQVSLQWSNLDGENINTYVNCCSTPDNGSHFIGFCKALYGSLSPFCKSNYKKEDLRIGLVGIIHLRTSNPTYSTQTKDKLSNDESEIKVKETLLPLLSEFFQKNKHLTDTIIAKAVKLKEARDKFIKNKAAIKNINLVPKHSKHLLPNVLLSALRCKPEERELFICEGKSAQGTLKNARDPRFQEVLSLRGKFTNAIKSDPSKIFKNDDIKNIFIAIGSNQNTKDMTLCDPKKARVGKIILLPDEDDDGKHIRCLFLSLFISYMKELISEGMIYIVDAPLYVTSWNDKKYYGNTLKNIRTQLPIKAKAKVHITRMKGWGECSKEDMKIIAMNAETRKLFRVNLTDQCEDRIYELMGSNSVCRKKLLGI